MHLIHVIVTTVTCLALGSSLVQATNLQDKAPSAGNSEPANIFLLEESAQALAVAVKSGLQDVTVLHIDNSDDLWPAPTEEQIAKAKTLLSKGDFETFETAGRALVPGTERLYSYVNHLVMAHRLGIIKEVYWAVPSLEAFDVQGLEAIMATPLNRSTPFAPNEGTSLEIAMPRIKGTISGVPVTIGLLRHFKKSKAPLWVDIEMDYFTSLYKNPVNSSHLGLLSGFVNAYQKLATEPKLLTITYGNADGQLPIQSRFLGPWLHTLLVDSQLLEGKPANTWLSKEEALYQNFFIQSDDAVTEYGAILKLDSANADAHYSLGILLTKLGQMEQAVRSLKRASMLDAAYGLGLLDATAALPDAEISKYSAQLYQVAHESGYASPLILRKSALYAQQQGQAEYALEKLQQLRKAGGDSPFIPALRGEIYLKSNQDLKAVQAFREAIAIIRNSPENPPLPALWSNLGRALEEDNDITSAVNTYREYLALFPNDNPQRITFVKERLSALVDTNAPASAKGN